VEFGTNFRPLETSTFCSAVNWNKKLGGCSHCVSVLFCRLSSSIAESLKGLFVLFAGRLVQNASQLLDRTNVCKLGDSGTEGEAYEEASAQLLLQYVLQTLYRVFQHDSGQGFVNKERFDALMQPLVDQVQH